MRLRTKLALFTFASALFIAPTLGGFVYILMRRNRLETVREDLSNQLRHINFSIASFFTDVENDVAALAADETVRTPAGAGFTNFLSADEGAFHYRIGETERKIIDIFNAYRLTHPYVNSVYMGRENGAFVRSHPRERPTLYDPRERPWYRLAKERPGRPVETEAYTSVTTPDVNIGVVTALTDGNGAVYGVVGADVTLKGLTDYISGFQTNPRGGIFLLDGKGTILAGPEAKALFTAVGAFAPGLSAVLSESESGPVSVAVGGKRHYAYSRVSLVNGWRLLAVIPAAAVEAPVGGQAAAVAAGLIAGLLLLGLFSFTGLSFSVVGPVKKFIAETGRIAQTAELGRRIRVRSRDEIADLADSFNGMLDSLEEAHGTLAAAEAGLRLHRDHLETLVAERTGAITEANERLSREIAERSRAEQTLAFSEAKYRDLVENVNSIIIRWTIAGRIVFMNAFARRFFGYTAEEAEGRNIVGTIVPETDASGRDLSALAREIRADPSAFAVNENENMKKNGERVWVSWTNRPVTDGRGEVIEILSVGNDVTQRRLAEERLKRTLDELKEAKERAESADRLKSAFLATMSHELRTPLNSIIGFTGIILQGLVGPLNGEQEKQLSMVRSSARHLLSLINDILDISKIEAGRMKVEAERFNLRRCIERAAESARPLLEKKGLTLSCPPSPGPLDVIADERRVEQILLNLISNAVKFTDHGSVTVTYGPSGGGTAVKVADTGIGIKSDDLAMIFLPFRQVDSGISRKYEGTGLGLSVSRKLAELMGGRLTAESTWGKGSVFTLLLPERDAAA